MDICARGFKAAAAMVEDGHLEKALQERYEGWKSKEAQKMLNSDLATITANVLKNSINPEPKSGKQEKLENHINRFV
jgi:xylose isomerase